MVRIEIKSSGQWFVINNGRIIDGDLEFSLQVKALTKSLILNPGDTDPDYIVAQEIVALHGGRIVQHEQRGHDSKTFKIIETQKFLVK